MKMNTVITCLLPILLIMSPINVFGMSYNITPGCAIKSDFSSGYWFLPVEMISKMGKNEIKYTPIYYVSCREPKCSLVRFPHDTDNLNVMNLNDIPENAVKTEKYTKNSVTIKWGLYNFYLTRDGMRVTEDQGGYFSEGFTKCPL